MSMDSPEHTHPYKHYQLLLLELPTTLILKLSLTTKEMLLLLAQGSQYQPTKEQAWHLRL
jgi:hypothetical protein